MGIEQDLLARVAQLEKALKYILNEFDGELYKVHGRENYESECPSCEALRDAELALSTSPSDYRRQLIDETIEKVARHFDLFEAFDMTYTVDEIRTLKGSL